MTSRITFPKVLAAGGAVGFSYYLYMRQHWFPDPRKAATEMKTPGTQAIENRFTAAGGAPDHTPATASKLGEEHNTNARHSTQGMGPDVSNDQRLGTKHPRNIN